MSDWDSAQYMKFGSQRTQPAVDLINRIAADSPKNVLDIGCGPGNSTAALRRRFAGARIIGADSSENMLAKAEKTYSDIEFVRCVVPDGLSDLGEKFDIVFSNACIHWIPDQEKVLKEMLRILTPGGVLAVQIPYIQEAPFYKMLYSLISEPRWQEKLGHIRNFHNLTPELYYDILSPITADLDIWQTTYYHIVPSFESIPEWYKGSGLRPYLDALEEDEREEFEREILQKVCELWQRQRDGKIILKMPRVFFTARKK